jgi:hypothetical protein
MSHCVLRELEMNVLQELELTDKQLVNISGGCAGHVGFGHDWGYGGYGFGGPYGYGAPYGYGYGYPQVTLLPVTAVQTTNCQTVELALI